MKSESKSTIIAWCIGVCLAGLGILVVLNLIIESIEDGSKKEVVGLPTHNVSSTLQDNKTASIKKVLVSDNNGKYLWVDESEKNNYNHVETLDENDPKLPTEQEVQNYQPPKPITKTIRKTCIVCGGTKQCKVCFGMPVKYRNGIPYYCSSCPANPGVCNFCRGKGETVLVVTLNPDGTAIGIDQNTGQMYTTGMADNFTKEERSSVSEQREEPEYMEKIVYAPNYTGDDQVYCPRCGSVGDRHSHIKERVK